MARPAAYVDAERLDACFGRQLGVDLCGRLRTSKRFLERLGAIIRQHYSLPAWAAPETCSEVDRTIALSTPERLQELARRSGATYWASTIANAILARQVEALHEQLGEAICGFALENRDLAGPEQRFEPNESIGARISADGWRCIGAWCHAQPEAVGTRVRLKLSPAAAIDDTPELHFIEIGPVIVRRAASR
jgi:hypothetical protein